MRITNRMITTKYTSSLSTLSSDLDKLNSKMTSGRAFEKSSENTSAAIKAYQLRRDLSKAEGYQSNIDHANSVLTNSEASLSHVQELVETAKESIVQGLNDTASSGERSIIATQLRNIQDQLLQTMNSNASDVYYFGGSNTDTKPFSVDSITGRLQYNGVDLDEPVVGDPVASQALIDSLKKDSLYVDIGMGVEFDLTGAIDKSTVFNYSTTGISVVGSGTTTIDGVAVSNNLYNLLGDIASEFEKPSFSHDKTSTLFGQLGKQSSNIVYGLTEIGAKTSYLDFMTNRLETQNLNNQERQMGVEGADPTKTIIQFKSQQVAYEAALQMGTRIIQPSIFDFMS